MARKAKTRGNGEGSIFQRTKNGNKIWVAQYTLGYKEDGSQKVKTFYGKTRLEVKNKLESLITEINNKTYVDTSKIKFSAVATNIVEDGYKYNKLSDASYKRKNETLKQIKNHYIADMILQDIKENDIKDFLFYITKYSNSVIGKIYGLVNNTFKLAVKKKIITYNFLDDKIQFAKPKSDKKDKKVSAFTVEEQQAFLNIILDNTILYKHQILLSMYTGMRMGEINALDIKDIDFKNKQIHIKRTLSKDKNDKTIIGDTTKTNYGVREIFINKQIDYILKDYIENNYIKNKENLLFYDNRKNSYITTSQVNMVFKRLCEKHNIGIGYNVNQHMLRHTFATRCIESGMPANVLQKIMGHNDIRTTLDVYCDVFANYEKQHTDNTYEYLKNNNLLISNINTVVKDLKVIKAV